MQDLAALQVDHGFGGGEQPLEQHFRLLTGTHPFENNEFRIRRSNGHESISFKSKTNRTRPSPRSVVPVMPRMPASRPSSGLRMISMRSPTRSTRRATNSPETPASATMHSSAAGLAVRAP